MSGCSDDIPDYYKKPTLVLCCGNVLFGDDGFGPAVAAALQKSEIPEGVYVMHAGIRARDILFPLLLGGSRVRKLIIVDAVHLPTRKRTCGEIFELPLDDIPQVKIDDFSMHQVPSSNLLRELRDHRNVNVIVLACQIKNIPDRVAPGLSEPVQAAIPRMCALVAQHWR
ncbi:MAG: hydrogenase maturation protease [Candidatus Thermoplasmatota archaeon]